MGTLKVGSFNRSAVVDTPEKQGSRGPEDAERNPRAAASAEAHEEQRQASEANDGKRPITLEELLALSENNPNARKIGEDLARFNKLIDGPERDEQLKILNTKAIFFLGRPLADLMDANQKTGTKSENIGLSQFRFSKDQIRFSGAFLASTRELDAIRKKDQEQGVKNGLAEQAMVILRNLREVLMPTDMRTAAEKALKESITEKLGSQLDEIRSTKADTQRPETEPVAKLSEASEVKQGSMTESKSAANPETKPATTADAKAAVSTEVKPEAKSDATPESKAERPSRLYPLQAEQTDPVTQTNVQLLEKALHAPGIYGLPFGEHVDFKQLKDVLEGLPVEQRQFVINEYPNVSQSGNRFFSDLRWAAGDQLGAVKEIENLLDRKKGVTDWAGDLQDDLVQLRDLRKVHDMTATAVEAIPGGHGLLKAADSLGIKDARIANVETAMRHTIAMMPSNALEELKTQHNDLYNQLTTDANVDKDTKDALKIMLENPQWGKSPDLVNRMVRIGLDSNNFDLFKDAMRFSSQEARDAFAKTPEAQEAKRKYSLGAEVVADLISKGNESLITELHQNTMGFGWLGAKREEVRRLVEFADPADRAAFTKGESLSRLKHPSEDQKALIDYFRAVDQALKDATKYDKTEYDVLKHKMMGTPELFSELRTLHSDGIFGALQKDDFNGMKKVVENLSEESWMSLRKNPEHLDKLNEYLKTFLQDDRQRAEIMHMLHEKVGDKSKDKLTYEQSREKGKRSVEQFFSEQVAENPLDPHGQTNSRLSKLERILNLTPEEKAQYRKDPKAIDKLVSADLQGDELLVARRKLKQILAGDDKADSISEAILANLHEADNATRARRLESALSTIDLKRLADPKTDEDKELRNSFEGIIRHLCDQSGHGRQRDLEGNTVSYGEYDKYIKKTFETGTVSMEMKTSFLKGSGVSIEDLMHLSKEDVQKLLAKNDPGAMWMQNDIFKSKEQMELAREILQLKNPNQITEVMRIRAAAVGFNEPIGKVIDTLATMKPKERAALEDQYLKYGTTITADLLHTATGAERRKLVDMYSPVPIGQRIISLQKELSRQDGAADGVLMGAAVDAHAKVAKVYAQNKEAMNKLDDKTREKLFTALENYYEAKANYVMTKRETAEAVSEATTILMSVAISIADPPASAAILASAGVVGAGVKLQMTRAMMGSDFDESQSAKIAASGFLDMSFGFADKVIPISKLIRIDEKIAAEASEAVCNKINGTAAKSIINEDAKDLLQKGMAEMSHTHCAFGSKEFDHEVHELATSLLKPGADKHTVEDLAKLIKTETRERISANAGQKLRNEVYKATEFSATETATGVSKEKILDPEKLKGNEELAIKSSTEMVSSLLKCMEMRVAGHTLGKLTDLANLQLAKSELFAAAKEALPKENYLRVIENTKLLEKRLSNNPKEATRTLEEVRRFFEARPQSLDVDLSKVPNPEHLKKLGEMTLFEVAHAHQIDQGMNNTCNVTVLQKQLAFNAPRRYAQLAADASVNDNCVIADGTSIKPSQRGAFILDDEGKIYEKRRDNWTTFEDLKRENFRSPSGKIMQTVIANAHWSRVERDMCVLETPEGLFVVPPKTEGAIVKKFAPGEIAFFGTETQHELRYKKGDSWVPFLNPDAADNELDINYSSPHIGSEHLEDMYNQVAGPGHFDKGFVLIGPAPQSADPNLLEEMSKSQTFVGSEEQLKQILIDRFASERGATALAVDAGKLEPGMGAGGHIVLGLYNQTEDNCMILNSWGRKHDKQMGFKQLFDCLLKEQFDGTPEQ